MKNTENYGLGKPESDEYYDVGVFNNNADIVDAELKKHSDTINELSTDIAEVKTSFQNGCDTIVAGCTAYGSTPASNSPEDIVASIGTIYEDRYNQGAESAEPTLQSKSATLKTTAQTIKADSGYDGLSQVTVPAVTGTASTANVLAGKTFNSATAGIAKTGTMTNNGAVAGTISTSGGTYTIPEGYHNGSGKVTGATLATLVGTNATLTDASKLLTGNTAYGKNGTKYTGSMANKAGTTVDASAVSQDDTYTYLTVPANGYYSTGSKIRTENSNLDKGVYDFNEVVSYFDYQQSSITFTATVGAIYQVVDYGYQGAQSQDVSISSGATLIKKLTCSSNTGCCVLWLKATATTVKLSATSMNNNIGCILKCTKSSIEGIDKLSTLKYVGVNPTSPISIPASTSGYSMFLVAGYQGAQWHGWFPSTLEGMGILGITSSSGYPSKGLEQWNLKTTKAYNMVGNNVNAMAWYAY